VGSNRLSAIAPEFRAFCAKRSFEAARCARFAQNVHIRPETRSL
jgi:hypothetical protein